ncbi:MAG TPA: hypothetical protein VM889_05035 [Candidatus Thermoplasmatota archaeon]|nr:hypothetical protein [Candidatus Thermoplasmatota archaeon]
MAEAVGAAYGAQLALHKNVLETARAGLEFSIALQRTGLTTLSRAMEVALRTPQPLMDTAALTRSTTGLMSAMPGLAPPAADRLARDAASAMNEIQQTAIRAGETMRDVTNKGVSQYEQALNEVETRSKESIRSLESGVQDASAMAARVTGAWVSAFFDATQAALNATGEAGSALSRGPSM